MKMENPYWTLLDIQMDAKFLGILGIQPVEDAVKPCPPYLDEVFEKSRTLLYGTMYEQRLSAWYRQAEFEWRLERKQLFANLSSVEEVKDLILKFKQVLDYIITSTVKLPNFSVSQNVRLSVQNALNSQNWEELESLIIPISLAFLGRAAVYYDAFVILAVLLLSRVYHYLISLVDRGGGKIYSSGSLEFRSIYISIVLFQGAYIWIKFREVAPESNQHPSRGLYRKSRMNTLGERVYCGNFEPRFKPPGSNNYISVGGYEQEEDAKACYQILAFWFGEDARLGELPLEDGTTYHIPTEVKEQGDLDLEQRKEWAKRAKAQFESYKLVKLKSKPVHPTGDALPPDLPECLDVIVPSGSIGVQVDDAHPFQLWNQGGDSIRSVSPSNYSLNVAPGTEGMQQHRFNDTPSDGVGGDEFILTPPESIARSQPEAATNIATIGTGESNEQPLEAQRPEKPLQGNQANDSAVNMIIDDFSLQRQVKELQRQRKESQRQSECQQLQIQHLETRCSSLESQQQIYQEQQQSRMQQMENLLLGSLRRQEHLLLHNQQMESRIQEQDSRMLELERANDVLESRDITRKRRCTCLTSTHDSQN